MRHIIKIIDRFFFLVTFSNCLKMGKNMYRIKMEINIGKKILEKTASKGLKINVICENIKIVIPARLTNVNVANNLDCFKKFMHVILHFSI